MQQINFQTNDHEGIVGVAIKAVKHSRLFNQLNPNHRDTKGWQWFNEVMNEYRAGNIRIYKTGHFNWFVLSGQEQHFLNLWPNAVPKAI